MLNSCFSFLFIGKCYIMAIPRGGGCMTIAQMSHFYALCQSGSYTQAAK
ncbi:hypothetical protein HMPREF0239_04135 [Clostridium sp. ATCC BAA-442]|nr:hypothetical protein HMPREF0239_04135 [Clostridium sp. ATCC BAA-442]